MNETPAVHKLAGESTRLNSGPVEDLAEPVRAGTPAVMMFVECSDA